MVQILPKISLQVFSLRAQKLYSLCFFYNELHFIETVLELPIHNMDRSNGTYSVQFMYTKIEHKYKVRDEILGKYLRFRYFSVCYSGKILQ